MAKKVMLGNEAIARGAYEGGVKVGSAYPGTPSTETFEYLVQYKDSLYCEWAPNEKVALEVAIGAAFTGARSIVAMKHVGLNVAADPLMTVSYTGIKGGLVIVVADDPGMHSSQNEQDTRHYARLAKIPIIEPANAAEAKEFTKLAFELSEKFDTPVILRSTTRVSHSKGVVKLGERKESNIKIKFEKNPPKFVPIPLYGRKMHVKVEERYRKLQDYASDCIFNRVEETERKDIGIIACGVAYEYAKVVFSEYSILKLSLSFPFPDKLLKDFCSKYEKIFVIEELEPFIEEHIKSLGFSSVHGKDLLPICGELNPNLLMKAKATLIGTSYDIPQPKDFSLPPRPPVLCPGCPHRSTFYALKKFKPVVTGDIGCYSLAVFPPLETMDTIVCMGAGISAAHGMDKAGEPDKVVGVIGDSTFFHSGITGLLDIAYNKGKSTIVILDNRITAMTGHQDHPGTGKTLMGEKTKEVSIAEMAKACGVDYVREVDPLNFEELNKVLKEAIEYDGSSVVVAKSPCALLFKHDYSKYYKIDSEKCKRCGACLRIGCPAIEKVEDKTGKFKYTVRINSFLCNSCGLCQSLCKFDAISFVKEE